MERDREARAVAPRRDFLKLAGLGGAAAAGAAAAAVVGGAGTARAAVAEGDGGRRGYRETAHVRRVYELSRF